MGHERSARLFLERAKTRVMLIAATKVRTGRIVSENGQAREVGPHRVDIVGAGNRHVKQGHDGAPEIDERFVGWLTCLHVNQPDVRGQRHGDAHQAVLDEVRIVDRTLPILAEVVGVHRSEKGIVGSRIVVAPRQQSLEPLPRSGRRQLETLRRHVAVRARAPVSAESHQVAVVERECTARDRATGLTIAVRGCFLALGQRT
jgi:hypothetical protein